MYCLFFHPQCMHCIELKPTWEKLKQQNVNSPLNILEVNAEMLHDLNHPVKNSVRGFPQIVSLENGQVKKNSLNRVLLENLNTFVNNSSKSLSNQIEELSKNMLFKIQDLIILNLNPIPENPNLNLKLNPNLNLNPNPKLNLKLNLNPNLKLNPNPKIDLK